MNWISLLCPLLTYVVLSWLKHPFSPSPAQPPGIAASVCVCVCHVISRPWKCDCVVVNNLSCEDIIWSKQMAPSVLPRNKLFISPRCQATMISWIYIQGFWSQKNDEWLEATKLQWRWNSNTAVHKTNKCAADISPWAWCTVKQFNELFLKWIPRGFYILSGKLACSKNKVT